MATTCDDFEDRDDSESHQLDQERLFVGGGQGAAKADWILKAHNKRVLKSWNALNESTPADVARCVEWLSAQCGKFLDVVTR